MATFTIITTPAEDARLVVAFGNRLQTRDASNARRNATAAEIRAEIMRFITVMVIEDERAVSAKNAVAGVLPFTPA